MLFETKLDQAYLKPFTQHIVHAHTNNGLFKLVEAFLQIHLCFFPRKIKLRGLRLSAVHSLAALPATDVCVRHHKRQKACYRNLKRTFEDLWPCSCYAIKDNSRTIGSQVWQIPFASKGADIVNCKLHDTRTVNLAVVKSVSFRKINCYCKN